MSIQGIKGSEGKDENNQKWVVVTTVEVVVAFYCREDTRWHTLHCSLESTSF